jgi:hypothetical protein
VCLISKLLGDKRFYHVLVHIDLDLAATARQAGCARCPVVLHSASFPRKPRGAPKGLSVEDKRRASLCCAACRKRVTPPSVRFLGRRIYLGIVVVLATAMQQGPAPWRASQLREVLGVSLQTLARWRVWWKETFVESAFWKAAKAAFSPPVDETGSPRSLLERFGGDDFEQLVALLRFVDPLSTPSGYVPDRRP